MQRETQSKYKYIHALDPEINRRVVFVVIGDYAYSLVTQHKFKILSTTILPSS